MEVKALIKKNMEAFVKKGRVRRFRKLKNRYVPDTQGYIYSLHFTRLQAYFALPLIGEDDRKDKSLKAALDRFFEWNYETKEESEENGDNEFYKWLLEDNQAIADREKYYLLSYWATYDLNESFEIAERYQEYFKKEIISLDEKSIKRLHSTYKKRCRREVREFRETKAQRIPLDLESLAPLLKWISLCFVVGGYAYANILYGHFDIPVGQFFSIGDYLATSLEQIRPLVFAILCYIAGVIYGYRRDTMITQFEIGQEQRSARIPERITTFACLFILIEHITGWPEYVAGWPERIFPPIALTFAVFWLVHSSIISIAYRYFENALQAGFTLLFLIVFGASLYFNVEHKIEEIEAGRSETSFKIVVQSRTFTEDNSTLVGSNSRYFFLKTSQDKVEVFRISQVDHISFKKVE